MPESISVTMMAAVVSSAAARTFASAASSMTASRVGVDPVT
jgi:hypothetical protein